MIPARLDHTDARMAEVVDHVAEEPRLGHEIGVEESDEFAARQAQPMGQRTRLEADPAAPPHVHDVVPETAHPGHHRPGDARGLVVGVVENLDLQAVGRILEPAGRADHALDHVDLVVDRKLDRDRR